MSIAALEVFSVSSVSSDRVGMYMNDMILKSDDKMRCSMRCSILRYERLELFYGSFLESLRVLSLLELDYFSYLFIHLEGCELIVRNSV